MATYPSSKDEPGTGSTDGGGVVCVVCVKGDGGVGLGG